ncbi:hypothetical protein OIU85_024256 [Salix viminalis]|uniref:Uncharacterized protein n=1 Tax=Salix viminalis TaxID=40686 RepID=A0A9Q0U0K0_SALVM|nr:hypothetical protein OIU85_024256 [Salix viminalis]
MKACVGQTWVALVPFQLTMNSTGHIEKDATNATYCVYNSDVATGYGVGAFLFLLSSESLLMGVTKCMCFGRSLAPGGDRAWSIIYFVSSWATFLAAEACLIAGAKKNAYHTKLPPPRQLSNQIAQAPSG